MVKHPNGDGVEQPEGRAKIAVRGRMSLRGLVGRIDGSERRGLGRGLDATADGRISS